LINSMKKKLISSEGKAPKSTAQQILWTIVSVSDARLIDIATNRTPRHLNIQLWEAAEK
jgi:hypothetical protein